MVVTLSKDYIKSFMVYPAQRNLTRFGPGNIGIESNLVGCKSFIFHINSDRG